MSGCWKGVIYLDGMFGSLMSSNQGFSQSLIFSHSHGVDPLAFNMATNCASFHRFLNIL